MKTVRLFQRHGHNPAGTEIELSDIQAQWMIDNGHAESAKGKTTKTDAPHFLNAAPPADETDPDTSLEPVKLKDTSPTPEPPAQAAPLKRKPGRPRKDA